MENIKYVINRWLIDRQGNLNNLLTSKEFETYEEANAYFEYWEKHGFTNLEADDYLMCSIELELLKITDDVEESLRQIEIEISGNYIVSQCIVEPGKSADNWFDLGMNEDDCGFISLDDAMECFDREKENWNGIPYKPGQKLKTMITKTYHRGYINTPIEDFIEDEQVASYEVER